MTRATRLSALAGVGIVLLALVTIPTRAVGAAGVHTVVAAAAARPGVWPTFQPGPRHASAPAGAHLTYYGGPVISNMKSVDVSYGSGSFVSTGHPGASTVGAFTAQFLGSGVNDWLSEFNTPASGGTNQHIGRGTYSGTVTITPSASNNGTTITDSQIQSELNSKITDGSLPTPDANTSYAVFFPLGKTICDGGSCSLVAGGFCAYHGTFLRNGAPVTYQVLPDLTGVSGCGNGSNLGNTTSVLSHELTETITDPNVGLASVIGPPLGWYDATYGEIGDICDAQQGTFVGTDATTYVLQQEFSNVRSDCIVGTVPPPTNDFSITAAPTALSLAKGTSGTSTINTAVTSGVAASVALTVTGAPPGATTTLSPTSISAGSSSTLTVNAGSAAPGTYVLTVGGTEGTSTHGTTVNVTITSPPLAITTTSLQSGTKGTPYAQTLSAVNGNAPYAWKLVKGAGSLPRGVKLGKTTGTLTGTPKAAGVFTFTVEVLDTKAVTSPHTQNTAVKTLSITIS